MLPTQILQYSPTPNSGFGLRAYFGLCRRVQANRRVSSDSLFWLRSALAKNLVQDDCTEGGNANRAQGKVADVDGKITGTGSQRYRDGNQVATLREIDVVLHPDATAGGR